MHFKEHILHILSLLPDSKSDYQLYNWNSNTSYLKNKPLKSKSEINFKGWIERKFFNSKLTNNLEGKASKRGQKISEIHVIQCSDLTVGCLLMLVGSQSSNKLLDKSCILKT